MAFFVHHSLPFTPIDCSFIEDDVIEKIGISVHLNNVPTLVFNIYVPPSSLCPPRHSPDLGSLFDYVEDADSFIVGDVNAHHDAWHSPLADAHGRSLATALATRPLIVLNENVPLTNTLPLLTSPLPLLI